MATFHDVFSIKILGCGYYECCRLFVPLTVLYMCRCRFCWPYLCMPSLWWLQLWSCWPELIPTTRSWLTIPRPNFLISSGNGNAAGRAFTVKLVAWIFCPVMHLECWCVHCQICCAFCNYQGLSMVCQEGRWWWISESLVDWFLFIITVFVCSTLSMET